MAAQGAGSINPGSFPVSFREWTCGREVPTVATNAGAASIAFQKWRNFKEAFAPEVVERAVNETRGAVRHVLDPFGGSGTTALACQFLGIKPTTIEVNPFLADLIEAKLANYRLSKAGDYLAAVLDDVEKSSLSTFNRSKPMFEGAPPTFIEPGRDGRFLFHRDVAERLVCYRNAIERIEDQSYRRLFRVALGSVAVSVSNVVVSGKGRRYRSGWQRRASEPEMVDLRFKDFLLSAFYDLQRFEKRGCRDYVILRGDARALIEKVEPIDLAVFSPPYPNSFDYTDVYNVELWVMGYLTSSQANLDLRRATLRSHVQIARDLSARNCPSPTLAKTLKKLREVRDQLWNRNIPAMVGAYTADLVGILEKLATRLRSSGRLYMVVGDSRYAGVEVPVARILAEIIPTIGYRVLELEQCRSMRASPQQGGQQRLRETLVIAERD